MTIGIDADAWAGAERALHGIGTELTNQRFAREQEYGILASLHVQLGKISDLLSGMRAEARREFNERSADLPVYADFALTQAAPSTGLVTFDCGGPTTGRIWHIKRLVVGGLHLSTPAVGSAEVYSTGWIPDATGTFQASLSDLQDATILVPSTLTQLPNIANYDDGQVVVQNGEHLWVVVRSATASQSYVVAGTAKDIRIRPHDVKDIVG